MKRVLRTKPTDRAVQERLNKSTFPSVPVRPSGIQDVNEENQYIARKVRQLRGDINLSPEDVLRLSSILRGVYDVKKAIDVNDIANARKLLEEQKTVEKAPLAIRDEIQSLQEYFKTLSQKKKVELLTEVSQGLKPVELQPLIDDIPNKIVEEVLQTSMIEDIQPIDEEEELEPSSNVKAIIPTKEDAMLKDMGELKAFARTLGENENKYGIKIPYFTSKELSSYKKNNKQELIDELYRRIEIAKAKSLEPSPPKTPAKTPKKWDEEKRRKELQSMPRNQFIKLVKSKFVDADDEEIRRALDTQEGTDELINNILEGERPRESMIGQGMCGKGVMRIRKPPQDILVGQGVSDVLNKAFNKLAPSSLKKKVFDFFITDTIKRIKEKGSQPEAMKRNIFYGDGVVEDLQERVSKKVRGIYGQGKMNPWMALVKKVKSENPNMSYKEVLLTAKSMYRK